MLAYCGLNDECAKCLGEYILNTNITKLYLFNKISDVGVNHIINHLTSNLTYLDLSYNNPVSKVIENQQTSGCCSPLRTRSFRKKKCRTLKQYGIKVQHKPLSKISNFFPRSKPKKDKKCTTTALYKVPYLLMYKPLL